jgi:hypothetical protein
VLVAGALALLMGGIGGRAYLDAPCDPLHRPSIDETVMVAQLVASAAAIPASAPRVPPPTTIVAVEAPPTAVVVPLPLPFVVPIAPPRGPPVRRVV